MAYSDKLLDHYENPRNVGSMDKTKDNVQAYQEMVSEDFRKKREERAKELEKKFGVEDDVDI